MNPNLNYENSTQIMSNQSVITLSPTILIKKPKLKAFVRQITPHKQAFLKIDWRTTKIFISFISAIILKKHDNIGWERNKVNLVSYQTFCKLR